MSRVMTLAAAVAGMAPGVVVAQSEVAFEVGASQVGPPSGLDAEDARFAIAGMRASHYGLSGSGIGASLMFGRAFGDTEGGDFVSGMVVGALRDRWGASWTGGLDLELVGFEVRTPFPYKAVAVEGGPSLSFTSGPVSTTAKGVFGVGGSRFELWRRLDGRRLTIEDELWRAGATGEVMLRAGPARAGLTGGAHDTPSGSYTSGGARLMLSGAWGAVELRGDVWETPLGREHTGGLSFVLPLSAWSFRGFFGKSEPDPLTLAEPGSAGGGITAAVKLFSSEEGTDDGVVPYEVLSRLEGSARVRIRVDAAAGTGSVSLLGDFTLWDPVPMRRDGSGWSAEVEVPEGTHHYGFLVDDEWYVPDDVRDVVPDEWGRQSAILVIEGAN